MVMLRLKMQVRSRMTKSVLEDEKVGFIIFGPPVL
jgi:hypothetical protein